MEDVYEIVGYDRDGARTLSALSSAVQPDASDGELRAYLAGPYERFLMQGWSAMQYPEFARQGWRDSIARTTRFVVRVYAGDGGGGQQAAGPEWGGDE